MMGLNEGGSHVLNNRYISVIACLINWYLESAVSSEQERSIWCTAVCSALLKYSDFNHFNEGVFSLRHNSVTTVSCDSTDVECSVCGMDWIGCGWVMFTCTGSVAAHTRVCTQRCIHAPKHGQARNIYMQQKCLHTHTHTHTHTERERDTHTYTRRIW